MNALTPEEERLVAFIADAKHIPAVERPLCAIVLRLAARVEELEGLLREFALNEDGDPILGCHEDCDVRTPCTVCRSVAALNSPSGKEEMAKCRHDRAMHFTEDEKAVCLECGVDTRATPTKTEATCKWCARGFEFTVTGLIEHWVDGCGFVPCERTTPPTATKKDE